MTNPFYTASGTPGTLSFGASQPVRSEFAAIQGGFDKFPDFTAAAPGTFLINNFTSTGITTAPGMVISPDGSLGIGTGPSPPTFFLDILRSQNSSLAVMLRNPNAGVSASAGYRLDNGTNTAAITLTGINYTPTVFFDRQDTLAINSKGAGGMSFAVSGASGTGDFRFYSGNSDASAIERMRIGAEGNVSIGTTTTLVPLTVLGTGDGSFFNATIVARAPNNPKYGYYASTDGFQWSTRVTPGGGYWALRYENGAVDPITVDRQGQVGIGKVPTRILDIQQDQAGTSVVALTNNAASGPAACSIQANTAGASLVMGALGPTFGGNPFIPGVSGNNQAFLESGGSSSFYIGAHPAVPMIFGVNRVERMRIDAGGCLCVGVTAPNAGERITCNQTAANAYTVFFSQSNAVPGGAVIQNNAFYGTAPNNAVAFYMLCTDINTTNAKIASNGGIHNYQANNVNLSSDVILKHSFTPYSEEELDALEDAFIQVDWSKWKYKDQTHDDWNHGPTAQGVEAAFYKVAPELVDDFDLAPFKSGQSRVSKGIYTTDLNHISHALLARLLRRYKAEARVR